MRREKADGTVTESLCRIGVRKKKQKPKDRIRKRAIERKRERENGIDCFVSRDSSERSHCQSKPRIFVFV